VLDAAVAVGVPGTDGGVVSAVDGWGVGGAFSRVSAPPPLQAANDNHANDAQA
jgi:hypothetical protein